MKIILDTNFLLIPSQFNVDIFSEIDRIILEKYKLFIIDKTIDELKSIIKEKNQKQRNKRAARLALQLIKAKKLNIIKTKEDLIVDDLILKLKGYAVATQDIGLKQKLKQKRAKIITLRAKKKLILI